MNVVRHPTLEELEDGLDEVRRSPKETGVLELIVRRPLVDQRVVLEEGELNVDEGLAGDGWRARSLSSRPGETPNPDRQLTLINARLIALLAQGKERWPLAGDQLYVDLDLSAANLPPGTRLALGSAVIEITAQPHTGCKKFAGRFGLEALEFISAPERKDLHFRGIYAKVVQPGVIRVSDAVKKL